MVNHHQDFIKIWKDVEGLALYQMGVMQSDVGG
jgi:hypothetical protein